MSTAGWADAARRVLGEAWIVTPERRDRAGRRPAGADRRRSCRPPTASGWRRRIPTVAKTAAKDARAVPRAPGASTIEAAAVLAIATSRSSGSATSSSRPPASTSRTRWACRRCCSSRRRTCGKRSNGACAGRAGTVSPNASARARPCGHADVVACGTDLVAEQALRLGARSALDRRHAHGVDLDLFSTPVDPAPARARLGLDGRFVVGWVGSFRALPRARLGDRRARRGSRTQRCCSSATDRSGTASRPRRGRGGSRSSRPARFRIPTSPNCSP